MSKLLRLVDRKHGLVDREHGDEIAWEDLSARYDELLKLRQRVRIAECGRAISPPGSVTSAWGEPSLRKAN